MSNQFLSGPQPQGTRGGNVPFLYFVDRDPTQYDSKNYFLMDEWLNTETNTPWKLVSLQGTNTSKGSLATWVRFGMGDLQTLTSNSGGAVGPDVNFNINVVGDGTTIVGVGNPATNTITFSAMNVGTVTSLTTDDGHIVTPTAGTIIIHGINGITTTGTVGPNTVTISGSGIVTTNSFPTDSGTATPASGVLKILAQRATLGAGSSVEFSAPGPSNTVQLNVTDANANTIIGNNAGNITLTASNSVGLGKTVLHALTSGNANTIVGSLSGVAITSGADNTSIGEASLNALTTGTYNVALGVNAGSALTGSESHNTLIGHAGIAGKSNFIAISAGSAVGDGLYFHNYGTNNLFVGANSGNFATTGGGGNTSLGTSIMTSITTASLNIGIGTTALQDLTSGNNNLAIGNDTLGLLTTGTDNTAVGYAAGNNILTGSYNILLGLSAGTNYSGSESSNIIIVSSAIYPSAGDNNTIRIGSQGSSAGEQNACFIAGIRGTTTIHNDAVAVLIDSFGQLGTVSSSARYKEYIYNMDKDSSDILKLRPVTFSYKKDPAKAKQFGLIAEEVEKILPELVAYNHEKEPESVKYHELPVLLLNELIKLKQEVEELKRKHASHNS